MKENSEDKAKVVKPKAEVDMDLPGSLPGTVQHYVIGVFELIIRGHFAKADQAIKKLDKDELPALIQDLTEQLALARELKKKAPKPRKEKATRKPPLTDYSLKAELIEVRDRAVELLVRRQREGKAFAHLQAVKNRMNAVIQHYNQLFPDRDIIAKRK